MQTIPEAVLAQIAQHRSDLQPLIANLRACPERAAQIEQAIATAYLLGTTRLSGPDTWHLAQVSYGGPWGGDWLTTAHAARLTGYDEAHLRRLARSGKLPAIKRGKVWYVRRDALTKRGGDGG